MASAIIHLCVAKKVNEYLKKDEKMIALGSIAPDLSKQVGQTKFISHFLDTNNEDDPPNIDRFLKKYRYELDKPFEMGYLIHLLTDKYWFLNYVPKYIERYCKEKQSELVTYTGLKNLIYRDYTNLNIRLIEEYNLDLYIFMNEFTYPESIITEIPISDLPIIVEKMGVIISNSSKKKTVVFDIEDIKEFIDNTAKIIIEDINNILKN